MFPSLYLETCTSTNDEVIDFVKKMKSSAAVFTFHQTQGRGQYGNVWQTDKNQNLAYSIALKIGDFRMNSSLFNFYTACIFRDFLANLTHVDVEIKWPNDMIIKGKKVSGMLIEKRKIVGEEYYIVGVGINVLQKEFGHLPKAGSLLTQCRTVFDLMNFAEHLHQRVCISYQKPLSEDVILEEFNKHLFRKNQISVFEKNGVRQNGIIKYADQNGFLWIELEKDGLQKFNNKEIQLFY